jgi:D-glycero-D-manno-heptose 1,7-bisphosphate phosphatase
MHLDASASKPALGSGGPGLHMPAASRLTAGGAPAPAVFLDRDGVIIEDVHFLRSVEQMRLLKDAAAGLHRLREDFYLIVVTNQSGVARGYINEERLYEIHEELAGRLAGENAALDAIYYCPHLPEAEDERYRTDCECRKPLPGMIQRAADDWNIDLVGSYVVGDSARDVAAGAALGVPGLLVDGTSEAAHAKDLAEAARVIRARD